MEFTIETADPKIRYSKTAQAFHWLTVVLVVLQFAIAWSMPDVGRGTRPVGLVGWHLSIGTLILTVTVARLGWRLTHAPPRPPRSLPTAVAILSRFTHWTMYALLLILPLLGWINANARGWSVRLFGLIDLPRLVPTGTSWAMQAGDLHGNLAIVLLVAVGTHIAGATYHAKILRDQTLRRML